MKTSSDPVDLEFSNCPSELAFQIWERKAEVAICQGHLNLWSQCLAEMPDIVVDPVDQEELILDIFQRVWKISPPSPKKADGVFDPSVVGHLVSRDVLGEVGITT